MKIRTATESDASAISTLIASVMPHLTIHPDGEGAEQFIATMSPSGIASTIASPNMRYLACDIDNQLAAVVAMRDNAHLYHMFVSPAFQRRGIATHLWQVIRDEALANGNPGRFTVNSSIYALPLYEAIGFRATADRMEVNGIAFVPMELTTTA